jgi:glycosyltransferase involved in cell wall biosynthesis
MSDSWARGLKVSFVIGVIVRRDAISNICLQQVEALTRHARRHRYPLSIKIYTTGSQQPDPRIATVADMASIASDAHFLESDVVIWHFGIFTPLFDSIHFAGHATKKLVYYHGITSPILVAEDQRAVLYRSYEQAVNLHVADLVLVTSRFLMRELSRMGIAGARIVRTPPAISFTLPPAPLMPRPLGAEAVRLLYVGRFVPAKGVLDLLRGVGAFHKKSGQRLRLDLVGSKTFSDPAYIARLEACVRETGLADAVHFYLDAPKAGLVRLLGEAHVLVSPSYHEGFCVPVLEAFSCGCFVICSDAGALPETSNGLGRTFAMTDAEQLAARLEEFTAARRRGGFVTDSGFLTDDEWVRRTRDYVADLSPARSDERFCDAALADLPAVDPDLRGILAERRRRLLSDLCGGTVPAPVEVGPEFLVDAALRAEGAAQFKRPARSA